MCSPNYTGASPEGRQSAVFLDDMSLLLEPRGTGASEHEAYSCVYSGRRRRRGEAKRYVWSEARPNSRP
jgi:hypothetical protein